MVEYLVGGLGSHEWFAEVVPTVDKLAAVAMRSQTERQVPQGWLAK
jgi:hypothetical protein